MSRICVIIGRGLGDVAIASIAVYCLAKQYPSDSITFCVNEYFSAVPKAMQLPNVKFDYIESKWESFKEVDKFYNEHLKGKFDKVAHLQCMPPSCADYLAFILAKDGVMWSYVGDAIDLVAERTDAVYDCNVKEEKPLLDSFVCALSEIGNPICVDNFKSIFDKVPEMGGKKKKWIGISPAASTYTKTLPLYLLYNIVRELTTKHDDCRMLIFGKGDSDFFLARRLKEQYPELEATLVSSIVDTMEKELAIMANCEVMIASDSSNGHMAALVGIPTITLWSTTHPKSGYAPYPTNKHYDFVANLPCQPCSLVGQIKCNDIACKGYLDCFRALDYKKIVEKVEEICYEV